MSQLSVEQRMGRDIAWGCVAGGSQGIDGCMPGWEVIKTSLHLGIWSGMSQHAASCCGPFLLWPPPFFEPPCLGCAPLLTHAAA